MGGLVALVVSIATLVLVAPSAYALDPPPTFTLQWGTTGTGNGQFHEPRKLAVSPDGHVYVADYGNNRIQKFALDGTFEGAFTTTGTGPSAPFTPAGVVVDNDGNVLATDIYGRVVKFSSSGTFISQFGSQGSGDGQLVIPNDLAIDAAGNIFVLDTGNDRVQKFTAAGSYVGKWGTTGGGDGQFDDPWGIGVDDTGNVYVGDWINGRVQKFTNAGVHIANWTGAGLPGGGFNGAMDVEVDSAGNVWVADYNRMAKFSPSGTLLTYVGGTGSAAGQFNGAEGLGFDTVDNLYVSDQFNNRVQKFAPAVAPANVAPVLSPETPAITTPQGTPGTVDLTASDADSDPLTWSVSGQGAKGTASVPAGTGTSKTVTYTPSAGETGTDSFTVLVADGKGATDEVTVSVTITAVSTPPPATQPITGFVASATGGNRVGEVRVAQTSLDGDPSLTLGYQWQHAGRGGTWVNIPGAAAQARSFELPPSVMKINVRVVVTAQRAGVAPVVSASGPLLILPGHHNASKLRIVGPHRVGKRLVAKVKVPDKADDLEIRYVWTVAGTQIRLTGRSIVVPAAAAGKKVFVDIRLVAPGYHNQELRSPVVDIR